MTTAAEARAETRNQTQAVQKAAQALRDIDLAYETAAAACRDALAAFLGVRDASKISLDEALDKFHPELLTLFASLSFLTDSDRVREVVDLEREARDIEAQLQAWPDVAYKGFHWEDDSEEEEPFAV